MIVNKPSIYIYGNNEDAKILREVTSGIEEEGVFFENSTVLVKYEDTIKSFPANDKLGTHSLTWIISGTETVVNSNTQITSSLQLVAVYTQIENAIVLMDGSNELNTINNIGAKISAHYVTKI
jgi:hypothetical protein